MTVATTQISEVWTGDASSVTFPIPFPFLDREHLIVWKEDAGGVKTAMTISTATGEGAPSGGSITLTAPVGVGYTLHVRRNTPKTQETDYVPHDPFPADSHERALDKLTMIVQELLASGSIDIDHFGDLIGGSSTIIWTRSPDGTKLIGSVVPGAGDTYKVKVDSDDAAPDFLGAKMLDENDIQFDIDGEALRNTVFQLSGLGSKLRAVQGVDFDFEAGPFEGAMSGGRGISFGRRFVAGVEVAAWVAQENRGTLHWTENVDESRWKETTEDAAFEAIHPSTQVNGWVGLAFVHVGGAINSWCWLFANADYARRIYYVIHEAASYNADGTINVAVIQYATYASGEGPIQIVDICQAGDDGLILLVGDDTTVGSTVDLVTFAAAMEADANVGGIGYDGYGVVQVVERDTGSLWRSDDSGATFAKVASFFLDGVEVAHLPSEAPFYLDKWGSLLAQYGQWVGVNTGYVAGRIGFVYSDDGVHWFSSADPATRFYSAASDGMRWFGTNGDYGTGSPIFEMIVSVIPVKRRLSMEKGAVVAGPLILRDLPNAPLLGTDSLGGIRQAVVTTPSTPTERHLIGIGPSNEVIQIVEPIVSPKSPYPLFDQCKVMNLDSAAGNRDILVLEDDGIIIVANSNNAGSVKRSTDWGSAFSSVAIPGGLQYYGQIFVTALGSILVYQQSGVHVARSTDKGATFATSNGPSGLGAINYMVQRSDGRILAYQAGQSAFGYSDDDGVTWTYDGASMVNGPVEKVMKPSVGPGFVSVAPSGVAKYSSDGVTWTTTTMPSYASVSNASDANGTLFCLEPAGSKWAKSIDGGVTWTAGGNSVKSTGGAFTEWVAYCGLALGFHSNATGKDYVMSKSYGLHGWTDQYWSVTQDGIMRVIASPSQNCLFVLSATLLFRVPLVDG